MVTREDGLYVLYPVYFDSKAARPPRRVPKDAALPSPTAEQVAKACARLRLKPVLEKAKHHPSRWHKQDGRVLIPARGSKAVLLRQIAREMAALRGQAGIEAAEPVAKGKRSKGT